MDSELVHYRLFRIEWRGPHVSVLIRILYGEQNSTKKNSSWIENKYRALFRHFSSSSNASRPDFRIFLRSVWSCKFFNCVNLIKFSIYPLSSALPQTPSQFYYSRRNELRSSRNTAASGSFEWHLLGPFISTEWTRWVIYATVEHWQEVKPVNQGRLKTKLHIKQKKKTTV